MLRFLLHGNDLSAAAQPDTEQRRQCRCHSADILRARTFSFPANGVQRVVQKMRIDLRLQRLQLCAALELLLHTHTLFFVL